MTAKAKQGMWINLEGVPERVVAIEYYDGFPSQVMTEEHWDHTGKPWFVLGRDKPSGTCAEHYDFDYCKRDEGIYYHKSGCGGAIEYHVSRFCHPDPPPAQLWVAPGVPIVDSGLAKTPVSDAELLVRGYVRVNRPLLLKTWDARTRNPFKAGSESTTVYCERCRDDLPTESLCEHIDWCDHCAMYVYAEGRSLVEETGQCDCPQDDDEEDDS